MTKSLRTRNQYSYSRLPGRKIEGILDGAYADPITQYEVLDKVLARDVLGFRREYPRGYSII